MFQNNTNHITNNILTKGWMNISALTKGFILPSFQYVIRRKGGLGGNDYAYIEELRREEELLKDLKKRKEAGEEIDYIQVFVNWDKSVFKYGKNIYAELIEKRIEAQISYSLSSQYNVRVELVNEKELENHIKSDDKTNTIKIDTKYLNDIKEKRKTIIEKKNKTSIQVELLNNKKDKNN